MTSPDTPEVEELRRKALYLYKMVDDYLLAGGPDDAIISSRKDHDRLWAEALATYQAQLISEIESQARLMMYAKDAPKLFKKGETVTEEMAIPLDQVIAIIKQPRGGEE